MFIDKAAVSYDKIYDYLIPDSLADSVKAGCRVMVPFGRSSASRLAMVLEITSGGISPEIKPITAVIDDEPIIGGEGIELIHYLKRRTFCRYFEAMSVLIPPGAGMSLRKVAELVSPLPAPMPVLDADAEMLLDFLKRRRKAVPIADIHEIDGLDNPDKAISALAEAGILILSEEARQKRGIKTERWIRAAKADEQQKFTAKQKAVIELINARGEMTLADAVSISGAGRSVVDRLYKLGAVELFDKAAAVGKSYAKNEEFTPPVLSEGQQKAADRLESLCSQGAATALLYGVTGSGKTSVYLHLLRKVLNSGKTAIVLVPEISLTPQTVELFMRYFGDDTAVIHSSLSATERLEAMRRINSGEVKIVVGTRSAVFAPLKNIGLIVIDEEQEHTYHSESAPRYGASEVAAFRCRRHGALLLLASATPSVEVYDAAMKGRINLVELKERYGGARLPDVYTIDLREAKMAGASLSISEELASEISYNLSKNEQSILLLNRRGYHTLIKCSSCGQTAKCPNCEVAMTYHAAGDFIKCHYCGFEKAAVGKCDSCGSMLMRYTGVGTQRVEEELSVLFPGARVLRMDADTTGSRYSHQKAFQSFAAGGYDIMVGTQMVAKGLNFPRVTLVGVLLADQSFYTEDFRSYERSFSLITQVVGRCGRGELRGRAFVQTYTPDNRIVPLAAAQDYPGFFREEIAFRAAGRYPPFCDLMLIGFTGERDGDVESASVRFAKSMAAIASERYSDLPLHLLGPSPFSVAKVAGKWRRRIIIKCRRSARLTEYLNLLYNDFYADKRNKGVTCYIDPYCEVI